MTKKIAYTFIRFPTLRETFILREILEIQKHFGPVELFSLLRPRKEGAIHEEAKSLVQKTHYPASFLSLKLWFANIFSLFHQPKHYLLLLAGLIQDTFKNPLCLAKTLMIFPQCVYFAYLARKLKIEHIHAHFASHPATAAYIMARLLKITYSITVHAYDMYIPASFTEQRLQLLPFIRTVCQYNVKILNKKYNGRIKSRLHVVRCGIPLRNYPEKSLPSLENGPFTILCVAALSPEKGHRYLLSALKLLKEEGREIRCILVGGGPLYDQLIRQTRHLKIEDIVQFSGPQSQGAVIHWLHQANCFVLPSVMEGLPIVLMEAMACALPVISSALTGIPELIQHGQNGLLVEPGNIPKLKDALSQLQDNPTLSQELAKAARKSIEKEYDIEKNILQMKELFLEIFNRS